MRDRNLSVDSDIKCCGVDVGVGRMRGVGLYPKTKTSTGMASAIIYCGTVSFLPICGPKMMRNCPNMSKLKTEVVANSMAKILA